MLSLDLSSERSLQWCFQRREGVIRVGGAVENVVVVLVRFHCNVEGSTDEVMNNKQVICRTSTER